MDPGQTVQQGCRWCWDERRHAGQCQQRPDHEPDADAGGNGAQDPPDSGQARHPVRELMIQLPAAVENPCGPMEFAGEDSETDKCERNAARPGEPTGQRGEQDEQRAKARHHHPVRTLGPRIGAQPVTPPPVPRMPDPRNTGSRSPGASRFRGIRRNSGMGSVWTHPTSVTGVGEPHHRHDRPSAGRNVVYVRESSTTRERLMVASSFHPSLGRVTLSLTPQRFL